jgi:hypothetical protein
MQIINLLLLRWMEEEKIMAGLDLGEAGKALEGCGLVNAALGSAEGNVVITVKVNGETEYLNYPSAGTSRPVPAVLTIS